MSTLPYRHARRLGLLGWLANGRRGLEGYLYLAHRLSGLALLAFLVAHIFVTATRLLGREAWEAVMVLTAHPLVRASEFLVYAAFAFHAANGVRLLLVELGLFIGAPQEPVYPYRSSVLKQRPLAIAAMLAAAVLILLGWLELFRFDH